MAGAYMLKDRWWTTRFISGYLVAITAGQHL
jgi:hypothetical protein